MAFLSEAYVFSLLAALSWGLGPVFSKRGLETEATWVENTLIVLSTRVVLFWVILLVTADVSSVSNGLTLSAVGLLVVAGFFATSVGRLSLYKGIDTVGSSVSSAVANSRPLFAVTLGILLLGEIVSAQMGVGVVVMVAGLVVLSISKGGDIGGWETWELLFPFTAAIGFASGNVIRRFVLADSGISTVAAVAINDTTGLAILAGYFLVSDQYTITMPSREAITFFATAGVLGGVGLLALFNALSVAPVSLVDPIVAISPLVTLVFAHVYIGYLERITTGLVVGAVMVVVGIVLVTGPF